MSTTPGPWRAEGEDSTAIEFARLLAPEIRGFVAPPAYT